jgi:hypothetical protein
MNLFESIESNIKRNIKYYSLNDIVKDPYTAVYQRSLSDFTEIYCYDMSKIFKANDKVTGRDVMINKANLTTYDMNIISNKDNPIIFTIFIKLRDKYLPKNTGEVQYVASQANVKGSNVIYPIATALSGGKIISDRDSVSDDAEWVWKKFFNSRSGIKKFRAIDNIEFPVTPEKEDDSIYNKNNILNYNRDLKYDILNNLKIFLEFGGINSKNKDSIIKIIDSDISRDKKIKEISKLIDLKKFLNDILEFSPLNFIYKDNSSQMSKTLIALQKLVNKNSSFFKTTEFKNNFNSKDHFRLVLYSLSEKLFVKRSSGII